MTITFRRVETLDFPLLGKWLEQPHVYRWWQHESTAEAVERDFGPTARGEEPAEDFVALLNGEPVGIIQRCRIHDYAEDLGPLSALVEVPAEAMTVDYFIGDLTQTGQGLGPQIISSMIARTWDDHPAATCVIVTVVAANRNSWRALEKAGLHRVAEGAIAPENPIDPPLHYIYRVDRPHA
ncbi:GNAT family N-acetyltransferase [Nonomuraea sp. NPDC048881]|uniref:GNAT family N-acetyltransferase n=1 Tax=Nonomuraea sp. NPDC048881 TaxID=3155030 RepID=UPI0033E8938E